MQLTIQSKPLLAALSRVKSVTSGASTLPVLSCLLLRAEGDRLTISANSLDTFAETSAECAISEPGSIVINCNRLTNTLSAMGPCELTLETDERHTLLIRRGLSVIRIHGLPVEEFPTQPEMRDAKPFELPQSALKTLISTLLPFVSTEVSRHVLCGIGLESNGGTLTGIATDGRRLRTVTAVAQFTGEIAAIVPTSAARLIASLCNGDATAFCCYTENQIQVKGSNWLVCSKLIEGNFPNYKQVIPGPSKIQITGPKDELLDQIRLASTSASKQSNSLKLSFGNSSTIEANTPGEGSSAIALNGFTSKTPIVIAFNPDFLGDLVSSFPGDEVTLQFIDAMTPLKIDDANEVGALFPMRIS